MWKGLGAMTSACIRLPPDPKARDTVRAGPTDPKRLGHMNRFTIEELSIPATAPCVTRGKYAAFAVPFRALACAKRRSVGIDRDGASAAGKIHRGVYGDDRG